MKISYWLRVIHRDLGFLVVGLALVYGLSGILLNHIGEKDPAFRTEERSVQLSPLLTQKELTTAWTVNKTLPPLKKIFPIDENHSRLMLEGGVGVYTVKTGQVDYETHSKRAFIYWINRLHYNKVKGWSPVADLFAVSLLVLAISGLVIVKGKKGLSGSGKWYLLAGLLIPIVYTFVSICV
ncbi:MAG: PepSY-associated TM helix domain-containing protein [Candidatus Symbiothrix sp.]|jgi:hypothetical protein|nr:PepSY-associated TM helix domain-containing protein [Candidatus Symbiothrix sp.]